uniref:Reverse transcriptase domain-containing protein n=1 Tax=Cannabis sativa TaxID=3483 RepID=A0A803QGD6_CANSA
MDSSSYTIKDMEELCANIEIEGEDDVVSTFDIENSDVQVADVRLCIVGLVNVCNSWTFNRIQLVFARLKQRDDPQLVTINILDIWVQVHNLQYEFKSKQVLQRTGNYIGAKSFISKEAIHVDALEEKLEENLIVDTKRCCTKHGIVTGPIDSVHSELRPFNSRGPTSEVMEEDGSDFVGHDVSFVLGSKNNCWWVLVKNFFANCSILVGLNRTSIVLIPKKKQPTTMSELRPISLCNVIYKVLENRLKVVVHHIISKNQSAFIPGHLISDNIMITFEVMHYLKRKPKGKDGYMVLKLDLSEAYNRIEWDFIRAMMLRMGFASRFVDLVLLTVTTVEYNVVQWW